MAQSKKSALQRPFYVRIPQDLDNKPFVPRQEPSDVPPQRIYENPLTCPIRINKTWIKHVLGALEVLNVPDTWIGTEPQIFNVLQDVELLMRMLATSYCGDDFMIEFRQNPDNPCQLEQSLDGGTTWRLAFDYEKCYEKMGSTLSSKEVLETLQQGANDIEAIETAITNDGLEDTFPEAVHTPEDPLLQVKRDALCWAINEWNRIYAKLIESSTQTNTTSQPISLAEGAKGAFDATNATYNTAVALFAPSPINVGTAISSIIYAVKSNWDNFWQNVGYIKDQIFGTQEETPPIDVPNAWIDKVSCAMYQGMRDQTLTQEIFSSSLSGIETSTPTEIVYVALWGIQIGFPDNWYSFLDLYNKFYRLVAVKENPYDCESCADYCYPLFHSYQSIAELPPDTMVLREYPSTYGVVGLNAVQVAYQPNQYQQWNFGNNLFGTIVIEYATPNNLCALGVRFVWSKGTLNSAIAKIWTYDGVSWTERASTATNLNQNRYTPITTTWQNTELIQWQKVRITVYTPQPRIHTFELFDLGT